MNRGGRPLHKYWEEGKFKKIYEDKKLFAFCVICKKTIRHTAESRLKSHRKYCQELLTKDEEFEEVSLDENNANTSAYSDFVVLNIANEENMNILAPSSSNIIQLPNRSVLMPIDNNGENQKASSNKKRKQIDAFIDKISCAEKTAIDSQLTKFLCGCNIPFDVLNSTHFKDLMTLLRPAYVYPSISTINNTLLNSVHDQLMTNPSICEQAEGILMISSSMINENVNLKHVVGIVHFRKTRENLFLKIWSIPINVNDVTEIVQDAIQISKKKYKVDIYAIIAGDDLCMSANQFNEPWFFKCQTTFVTKIVNLFRSIPFISKVQRILNGFQAPRIKEEIINRGGFEFEVVDNEASIISIKDMFINCLKNSHIFKQILTEHVFHIPNDAVTILLDATYSSSTTSFEQDLEKIIFWCEHFCSIISKCQNPCTIMCDIIERWLQIESRITGDNSMTEINKEICAILSPISIVANYLHPAYRELTFENNSERNVEILEYLLIVLNNQELDHFYEYSQKGIF